MALTLDYPQIATLIEIAVALDCAIGPRLRRAMEVTQMFDRLNSMESARIPLDYTLLDNFHNALVDWKEGFY